MQIHHINCGTLRVPSFPTVVCHCLALVEGDAAVLVDAGIGLADVKDPSGRFGDELIAAAGFQFNEPDTALRRLEKLGVNPRNVRDIILTHADPDHAGGIADFPAASIHLASEEFNNLNPHVPRNPRYLPIQFSHAPRWRPIPPAPTIDWFGLPARPLDLPLNATILLIPLFGHTNGHCGVAIEHQGRWLLHVGDAYYLRAELSTPDHPVTPLAAARADDNAQRIQSLESLRRLARDHADLVSMIGYHDITQLPAHAIDWPEPASP